jgi:hypothetical protein
MLILPIHKHGSSLHLLRSSISLFSGLSFSLKSLWFLSLNLFQGTLLFLKLCKWECFPDFFLSLKAADCYMLILCTAALPKEFMISNRFFFFGRIFGVFEV